MKKLLSGLMVALVATVSLAQTDVEAQKQLDVIRDGLDNTQYQIRSLRVMPGGSVTLPSGAIGSSELASNLRSGSPVIDVITATAPGSVATNSILIKDSDGVVLSNRYVVTAWVSTSAAYGIPATNGVTGFVVSTGAALSSNLVNGMVTLVTDANGAAAIAVTHDAVQTRYLNASVGGISDSATSVND
jgi:hypothetical protein